MIYQNLQSELTTIAERMTDETKDRRFKNWAKFIDSVDPKGQDGYAFKGDWINDGTVELELGTPRLALVYFRHGSMKYNYGEYAVVKITVDGKLEATDIMASDADGKGWALRVRDLVLAELVVLDPVTDTSLADHEQALMDLGYNQAMLDYAQFPITGAGDPLERASIEKIVARLRAKLNL